MFSSLKCEARFPSPQINESLLTTAKECAAVGDGQGSGIRYGVSTQVGRCGRDFDVDDRTVHCVSNVNHQLLASQRG